MSRTYRNEKGQFANPTDTKCVVNKDEVKKNQRRLEEQRRLEARKRAEKKADKFLQSENPLVQGLKALMDQKED